MILQLTEEQRQSVLKGEPVRLSLPESGADIVLLRAETFDAIRELIEDERERKAIAQVALKAATRWAQENPY